MSSVLALTSVSKRYGALQVTDDISFEVEQGETYGILGPNGAGKTTLFNLVSGDVRPDAGSDPLRRQRYRRTRAASTLRRRASAARIRCRGRSAA